jgi:hypothetical protein
MKELHDSKGIGIDTAGSIDESNDEAGDSMGKGGREKGKRLDG